MSDLFERLLIFRIPGIGAVRYNALVGQFGSVVAAAESLNASDDHRDAVLREMERAQSLGIEYICDDDARYPQALKAVSGHPPIITARGNIQTLSKQTVAMVGTRHATAAGMNFMADIAQSFAEHDYAVISGMAIGCDTAAHRGALRAYGDSVTVAVLAGGVDYIWPLENEGLYHNILARGVVVSEMPVGFVPVASNFIQRNRLVAGIGQMLILGEADMKSGSMTTARFAHDIGRQIYAIPSHPADARGAGPNSLIQRGCAKLCMGVSDFFDSDTKKQNEKFIQKKTESENPLLDKLGTIPVSESVLSELVGKNVSEIKRDLVILELRGIVRKIDGGYVLV